MTRIDSLCLVDGTTLINNCKWAFLLYDEDNSSRCYECATGFERSNSWAQCYKIADSTVLESGYVENCNLYDGPWCIKCRENVVITENTIEKTIHYILTDANTCVREPESWIGKNCAYAVYPQNNHGVDRKLQECKVCRDGYKLDKHNELDPDNCIKEECPTKNGLP